MNIVEHMPLLCVGASFGDMPRQPKDLCQAFIILKGAMHTNRGKNAITYLPHAAINPASYNNDLFAKYDHCYKNGINFWEGSIYLLNGLKPNL